MALPANLLELMTTSGSTTKAQLDYAAINAMGRIGKITSSVSSVWSSTYTYDNADQVTRANTTGTVAPADNRYTYDVAANVEEWRQIISGSSTCYPYTKDTTNFTTKILKGTTSGTGSPYLTFTKDANGNVTGWTDAISGKSETLAWDAENRLVSVTQSPANKEFVMTYDGRNRLTIIEEKLSGVTQKSTRLVWSGMEICEERDNATDTVITKYYPDGELQWTAGTWVPIWYYRDHLGSILETYSVAGTRVSQRRFDEWGRMTGSAAGPGVSKKGYTGHYQPEGMDYVMAPYRWYSPTTRSWLSRDPIGEAGGVNLYGYVANNPINLFDPYGLWTIQIGVTVSGLAGVANGNAFAGFAFDSNGGFGSYWGWGGGVGAGATVSGGLSVGASNGNCIEDLGGPFGNTSADLGAGLAGSVDAFAGQGANGQQIVGGGLTIGAGGGAGWSAGASQTYVNRIW